MQKPRKNFLSQSVQELLKPQSSSVQRREILEHKRVENRRKESMLHEEEITMLETRKQAREKVKKKKDDHSKEVKLMAEDLRKNLSEQDINAMIKNNRKYYQKIEMGQQPSWRHKMFNYPTNKSKNERHLLTKLIAAPFSDIQQEQIFNELQKMGLPNKDMQLKMALISNWYYYLNGLSVFIKSSFIFPRKRLQKVTLWIKEAWIRKILVQNLV